VSPRRVVWSAFLANASFRTLALAVFLTIAIEPVPSFAADSWDALKQAKLTATGRVLLPDGSPAANAILCAIDSVQFNETARTDAQGRFQLRHLFGNYVGLHAHTSDWRLQACLAMSAGHARIGLGQPVELQLAPAREQQVVVKSQGRPIGGIKLVAVGNEFRVQGTTGIDGRAFLWIPHGRDWRDIYAWDPKSGGAEIRCYLPLHPSGGVELALQPPRPHTIRLIDQGGNPMRNLQFSLTYFGADEFEESSVQTNSKGEVTVPWVPAGVSFIEPFTRALDWTVEDRHEPSGELRNETTIQVRRRRPVQGRLLLPLGVNPEGILVMGEGDGTGSTSDIFFTRARRDGTFVFPAAANHGYAVGIFDDQWACDLWTGVILASDEAEPAEVTLEAYRATPLTLQVTWGRKPEPWNGPFFEVVQSKEFEWTDARGERHDWGGGLRRYCPIDADGTARVGVARGECKLRVHLGPWEENRTVNIESDEPVSVAVHRPFKEHRELTGRLMHMGAPYRPTPSTALRAWSIERSLYASSATVTVATEGAFHITADTDRVGVYVSDPANSLCVFQWLDKKSPDAGNELELKPTGVYSGQIIGEGEKPVSRVRIKLSPQASDVETLTNDALLEEAVSDDQGRFTFRQAPTGVILWPVMVLPATKSRPPQEVRGATKSFLLKPGERRQGERIQVATQDGPTPEKPVLKKEQPAVDRLAELIRDARVLNLRVLVGAVGDATDPVEETRRHLVDVEEVKVSQRYFSLWVPASELQAQSKLFSRLKLRPPKAGEVLLVVLDGEGRQVDFLYLVVGSSASAFRVGDAFLKKHAPPARDAQELFAAARKQSRATGRRVWILATNPSRPASVRWAQWWEEHRALLERDYVFVKLVQHCDAKIDEVMSRLEIDSPTEPWSAITDAAGKALARDGGVFPTSPDDRDNFRNTLEGFSQKLTTAEIDRLMQSLHD
jgi:hypothetical protein